MAIFMNAPDKLLADAFSDPSLKNNANGGSYSAFTNQLNTPLLGLKGIQLLRMNFVNSALQLNDYNGQLFFLYYKSASATPTFDTSYMHCVRLLPSWYVPRTGYTSFVRNKYFNSVSELITALNAAAATNGDTTTANPTWLVNDITFSYDTTTRRISFTGNTASSYYSPVAYDDPNVATFFANSDSYTPKMIGFNSAASSYAAGTYQPWRLGNTMNFRLGFAMAYSTRGRWVGSAPVLGCASATQVPQANTVATEADALPILISAQSINVYMNIAPNSGYDSKARKNLVASIPVESASQYVGSYTLTSVEQPLSSVQNEVYTITFNFTDEYGNEYFFNANNNVSLEFNCFYDKNKMVY